MTAFSDSSLEQTRVRRRFSANVVRAAALFAADLGAILTAATVAFLLHMVVQKPPMLRAVERVEQYGMKWSGWGTLLVLALLLAYFAVRGHYTLRLPFWLELKGLVLGSLLAFLADGLTRVSVFGVSYGLESGLRWLLMIPAFILTRHAAKTLLARCGFWTLRTMLIGERSALIDARTVLNSERGLGYEMIATTTLDETAGWTETGLGAAIWSSGCEFVVFVVGAGELQSERSVISALDRLGVPYALMPALSSNLFPTARFRSQHFFTPGAVMLIRENQLARFASRSLKTALDSIAACLLVVLFSPVFLILFWKVRADGGPALFRHERIGANGKPFYCLKFRTMVTNADQVLQDLLLHDAEARTEWATKRKLTKDPRVTSIGSFLRNTSLDELPQLFNVIRGEMSLVGPRPIVQAETHHYGYNLTYYCEAKPGITGLWQVSGRSCTTYDERVKLDVWYVQNWSLWHDGAILFKTIPAVLTRKGAQ
jgi:Undecaprenyl-phosphate galactose phosphotransferase WbaP